MTKYAIIDWTNGDCFEEIFETKEEAIIRADYEWDHLTTFDKNRREFFAVMEGDLNEDECFDINTASTIKEYTK